MTACAAARALGRNQAEIRHELAGIGEAGDVAEFCDQRRRGDKSHPAQRLERPHHGSQRPIRQRRLDMGFQTVAPGGRRVDGRDAIFQHDVVRRPLKSQAGHPPTVHQRPRRSMVVMAMAQQETGELLTSLTQTANSRQTRPHEIADRFVGLLTEFVHATRPARVATVERLGASPGSVELQAA